MPPYRKKIYEIKVKKFLKEYIRNGCNGALAVKTLWPDYAEDSNRVVAHRLLTYVYQNGLLGSCLSHYVPTACELRIMAIMSTS